MRDASAVVSYCYGKIVGDIYFYPVSGVHLELVDGVVDNLLEEHVYTIFGKGAVAQPAYIHTGSCAHMLHVAEVSDVVIGILNRLLAGLRTHVVRLCAGRNIGYSI